MMSMTVQEDTSDAAAEFAHMRRTLALLVSAQEGFATRLQEIHGRDYSEDLARIVSKQHQLAQTIGAIKDSPAMRRTVEDTAAAIEKAGVTVRQRDHEALHNARQGYVHAMQDIREIVASARTAKKQEQWVAGASAGSIVLGIILCAVVPISVAHSVPEGWHWPEQRAARELHTGEWDAGVRLLEVGNPDLWNQVRQANKLMVKNVDAIDACEKKAAKTKKAVQCDIEVGKD
jgi:hypothetical protein